jgi:hypothetical protein
MKCSEGILSSGFLLYVKIQKSEDLPEYYFYRQYEQAALMRCPRWLYTVQKQRSTYAKAAINLAQETEY